MSIYVGEKNALLLKGDKSVVAFYKGNQKIFDYNASKSGEIVKIDDASPIEHKMKIQLESDTISDFSNVSITRCGKNLFDANKIKNGYLSNNLIIEDNGFSFQRMLIGYSSYVIYKTYFSKGTYYIKGEVTQKDGLSGGWALYRNGEYLANNSSRGYVNHKFIITTPGDYEIYFFCNYSSPDGTTVYYKNIQIECNGTATDYCEYNGLTVKADSDGNVDNILSLPRDMVIYCNSSNEEINILYCKNQ